MSQGVKPQICLEFCVHGMRYIGFGGLCLPYVVYELFGSLCFRVCSFKSIWDLVCGASELSEYLCLVCEVSKEAEESFSRFWVL